MQNIEEGKLEISKLESKKIEVDERLNLLKNQTREIEKLKENVRELQREQVYKVIHQMSNRDLKGLLTCALDKRLTVVVGGKTKGKQGKEIPTFKAIGTYNLEAAYNFLLNYGKGKSINSLKEVAQKATPLQVI
jgi:hypothetical protein